MEDKKKTDLVSGEKQVCSVHVEPLIKNSYTMKALQSSNQPDILTWDSVGDQVTYNADGAITMQEWKRQCIYLCSSDQIGAQPGYFFTDYDGYFDLPAYGNMLFKAAMGKLVYDVALPPYTSATIEVKLLLACTKISDYASSSTWVGGVSMKCDHCKTIGKYNKESGVWSGVPSSDLYNSAEDNYPAIDLHCLGVCDYKRTVDNTSDRMQHHLLDPIYLMSMLECPKSYSTYLGFGDTRPFDKIIVTPQFTSLISYNNNEVQKYIYSDRRTKGILLKKPERTGYIMKGWLDGDSGRRYPAGGYYAEKRGINLTEQWIEDVVPYTVVHYSADRRGKYSKRSETFYYMAGGTVCPQPDESPVYIRPEPITARVAEDGSTVIEYYYEIREYPVQYCANGGIFPNGKDILETTIPYGLSIDLWLPSKDRPKRTGYYLDEWFSFSDTAICYAVVAKAVWKAIEYTVQYDKNDDNATGEMNPQGFVYDQPQQLRKNTYECKHTVSFAVGDRRGDNAYFQPHTTECHFMGWAETATGEKVYGDEAAVCNLTSNNDETVTLYAVWKSASILLPQFYHEGYYFDAWYLDEDFKEESKAGEPGCEYFPTGDVTLYGRLICTKPKNLRWEQGDEPVEERTIKAAWDPIDEATAYFVQLMDVSGDEEHNLPFKKEDLQEGDKISDNNTIIETTNPFVSLTATLAQYTSGGKYTFTVQPKIEGIDTSSNESGEITTLARAENPEWKDGNVAVWDSVEGADYYLVWIYCNGGLFCENTHEKLDDVCEIKTYGTSGSCVQSNEPEIDLSEVVELGYGEIQFSVLGYSNDTEECYTPQYEKIISSIWNA